MKKYWRIRFDDNIEGIGWLEWNETMSEAKILDDNGEEIKTAISYTTIDTELSPDWSENNVG